MKFWPIYLIGIALLPFLSGCASSESSGGYTPTQLAAQHSGYDPTPRTYGTAY